MLLACFVSGLRFGMEREGVTWPLLVSRNNCSSSPDCWMSAGVTDSFLTTCPVSTGHLSAHSPRSFSTGGGGCAGPQLSALTGGGAWTGSRALRTRRCLSGSFRNSLQQALHPAFADSIRPLGVRRNESPPEPGFGEEPASYLIPLGVEPPPLS